MGKPPNKKNKYLLVDKDGRTKMKFRSKYNAEKYQRDYKREMCGEELEFVEVKE